MIRILLVAGARPNFMKVMPLIREFRRYPRCINYTLVHTGQHYDFNMSLRFFKDLDIPRPDIYLGIGSGTHGVQTARVIEGIEKILLKDRFDIVVVVGDVNSTLAAALAAVKLGVKVAHVEAGLRSFDRSMPEEINRLLTDHIADYLFITEESARKNLLKERIAVSKIFFVGNIMIDSYYLTKDKILRSQIMNKFGLKKRNYCLVTIHRPTNVDTKKELSKVMDILQNVSRKIKVVYPVHPRTKKMLYKFGLAESTKIDNSSGIFLAEPSGYVDFQRLLQNAKFVITDSGGIQEEATVFGIPCLTMRTATERPITVTMGTNEITGTDKVKVLNAVNKIMLGRWKKGSQPPLWDGKTAGRIVGILLKKEKNQIIKI